METLEKFRRDFVIHTKQDEDRFNDAAKERERILEKLDDFIDEQKELNESVREMINIYNGLGSVKKILVGLAALVLTIVGIIAGIMNLR